VDVQTGKRAGGRNCVIDIQGHGCGIDVAFVVARDVNNDRSGSAVTRSGYGGNFVIRTHLRPEHHRILRIRKYAWRRNHAK